MSTAARASQIPVPSSSSDWPLVGRQTSLSSLEADLAERGCVVIAGEAGVGKTRLAGELAARVGRGEGVRVAASTSLRGVPLGAFAALLPPASGRLPRMATEALRVAAALIASPDRPAPLLCVDDVHLLDDLSAGLVLELAATRRARIVATVRSSEACPDAVLRLWRDGHASRFELLPLDADDVAQLLGAALGGPVDGATHQRFWNASRGNLLYLRELVRMGLGTGALADRGGVWIWEGPLVVSPELRELVAERLAGLDPATRAALEAVAVAEPSSLAVAERMGAADHLVDLERHGLLEVHEAAGSRLLRLAHPLFGQVVRAALPPLRAAELARRHGAALAATGDDLLRLAIAQADGLVAPNPGLLLEATTRAVVLASPALATHLARAALHAGGGGRALAILAECLSWEQKHEEALELIASHPIEESDLDARIVAGYVEGTALFWGFGRGDEALAALRRAEALAPANPFTAHATGQRAVVTALHGRPADAIALARDLLDAPAARAPERVYAYSALSLGLALVGRFGEAIAEAGRGVPLALELREALPFAGDGLPVALGIACFLAGRFETLDLIMGDLYRASAENGDEYLGLWAHWLARGELARGRLAAAESRASEAAALLRRRDPGLLLPWALAVRAQVAAQRGDVETARSLVAEIDTLSHRMAAYCAEIEAAQAWTEAATGEVVAARRRLVASARHEQDVGRLGPAAFAAHEAGRLGAVSEAAALLEALATHVDGALPAAWVRQTRARAERDAEALSATAAELASIGALLDAAESAAAAAALHRARGRRAAARREAARARSLAAACGQPRTPALADLVETAAPSLTARELHVARLAVAGRTRREIASLLSLSPRTVANHLNRIYSKLGASDRASLAAFLGE